MAFRALELFAGIAGITHGLRGIATPMAFVEIDKDAQDFLTKKFPEGKLFKDVTQFTKQDFNEETDMITAGFPCTGFSNAGNRTGFEHKESGLFSEVVRLTEEYMPKIVFLENSHMLSHKYNLDVVIQTMDKIGYNCKWATCRASAVGAHHCRHRWFCLCIRKDYTPENINVDGEFKKFDWESNQPPIQVDKRSAENNKLVRFSGYSVVPDQIRFAFTGLFTGKFDSSFEPVLVPGTIDGIVSTREDKIDNGWYKDGVYYEYTRKDVHRPPVNITVSPREIPEKHNGKVLVAKPMVKKYWCTPCASYGKGTSGGRVLTDRGSHSLPTQVRFSTNGVCGKHLSGKFTSWLMGYDAEYLEHLVEY